MGQSPTLRKDNCLRRLYLFYQNVFLSVGEYLHLFQKQTNGNGGGGNIHDFGIKRHWCQPIMYLDKNEKHFHPHLFVIHSFRLSLECFDADRRSLEGKKLNENSHRSPSFYTHTMSFKDFFRDFWWISNIPNDSHWFFSGIFNEWNP